MREVPCDQPKGFGLWPVHEDVSFQQGRSHLEIVNGRVVQPKGKNERDLYLDRKLPDGNENIAVYPVSTLPGPGDDQAVPLDRKRGLADCRAAEQELVQIHSARGN